MINNHNKYYSQYEVPSLSQIHAYVSTLTIPSKHSKNKVINAVEFIAANAFIDKLRSVDESCREKIMIDLKRMHYALTYDDYCFAYTRALTRWDGWIKDGKKGVNEFKEYMNRQWFFSIFFAWQIYITPPGYRISSSY